MDSNMIEKLKAMLDDPQTISALANTLNEIMPQPQSGTESGTESSTVSAPTEGINDDQSDMIIRLKDALSQSSSATDPRINLLSSLKPYMRPNRSAKMDQAIKLIQISKIASMFK